MYELISPGSLPIGMTLHELCEGEVTPRWRNQALAWFLARLQFAQAEGQGIRTIRDTMRAAGCPAPIFKATEVSVACVLPAHPRAASWSGVGERGMPYACGGIERRVSGAARDAG